MTVQPHDEMAKLACSSAQARTKRGTSAAMDASEEVRSWKVRSWIVHRGRVSRSRICAHTSYDSADHRRRCRLRLAPPAGLHQSSCMLTAQAWEAVGMPWCQVGGRAAEVVEAANPASGACKDIWLWKSTTVGYHRGRSTALDSWVCSRLRESAGTPAVLSHCWPRESTSTPCWRCFSG